jgi:hypothetical protein
LTSAYDSDKRLWQAPVNGACGSFITFFWYYIETCMNEWTILHKTTQQTSSIHIRCHWDRWITFLLKSMIWALQIHHYSSTSDAIGIAGSHLCSKARSERSRSITIVANLMPLGSLENQFCGDWGPQVLCIALQMDPNVTKTSIVSWWRSSIAMYSTPNGSQYDQIIGLHQFWHGAKFTKLKVIHFFGHALVCHKHHGHSCPLWFCLCQCSCV